MLSVNKVMRLITRVLMYISVIAVSIMTVLTVVDVVRRYIIGLALTGVVEYCQMCLIVSMTAMAYALVENKWIVVNVFVERFPKALNLFFEVFMGVLSFVFLTMVGVQLLTQVGQSMNMREAYFMIGVPKWPMYLALGISFLACSLATVVYVYERVTNYKNPKEKTLFEQNPEFLILGLSDDSNPDEEVRDSGS